MRATSATHRVLYQVVASSPLAPLARPVSSTAPRAFVLPSLSVGPISHEPRDGGVAQHRFRRTLVGHFAANNRNKQQ